MKHINNFYNFSINEEWSKNDAIPELRMNEKLGIILLGTPGVGKSTFVTKYILPRNSNIKTFSSDDVSLTLTKDPNNYRSGSIKLNVKRLKIYIESGKSFIYDVTGTKKENILDIYNYSKNYGYKLIIIHLVAPLDVSINQNMKRDRNVDINYLINSYKSQFTNMSMYSRELNPDGYYIVKNRNGKYIFSKYVDNKIIKNKNAYLRDFN